MDDCIHELLHRNLKEVLAKATRRGVALPSQSSIPKTACSTRRPVCSPGAPRSTNLPEIFAPSTRTSFTPHGEPQALPDDDRLAPLSGRIHLE